METILAILGWILFGFVIGIIARFLMPGRQPMGFFATAILGVIGSLAGGMVAWLVTGGDIYQPSGWIMSIIGAVVVLAVYVSLARGSARRRIP